ncbi:MAG: flagellin [Bdellovibrionales bacterium GWA2_49_15]|nr:MAG: flagellin [Bdellovibrionales bacterium GWA2_49_15]
MGLRIATNVQSIGAQRSLSKIKHDQDGSLEKLSSGLRINRASDDAAGLAISEKMKATIRGTQQASRNAQDGISMIQVAEGGLEEVSSILIRLRELSVQAANDTLGDNERRFTNLEYQQLSSEIDRIAGSTTFNGRSLLKGEGDKLEFQVGTENHETNDRIAYDSGAANVTSDALGLKGTAVDEKGKAQTNLGAIDLALDAVNGNRANLGALQNRLQSTISNLDVKTENLSAANSRIRDADVANESAQFARANILSAASTSVLAQANQVGQGALKLIG